MKYIEQFIAHLNANHYSPKTVIYYRDSILVSARKYFDLVKIDDEREVTEKHIFGYINHLKTTRKLSDNYFSRLINYLKIYFTFLEEKNLIFINPFASIDNFKEKRTLSKALSQDEIKKVFNELKTDTPQGVRVRMILELAYSSALRPGEITNLKINQIDFNNGLIHIDKSKFQKSRTVPVGREALKWIKKYLAEVRPLYMNNQVNDYLIVSFLKTGNPIPVHTLQRYVRFIMKKNNLTPFKLYTLRTTSATHLLLNGMHILHIKDLLGHNNLTATQIYLRLNEKDLQKELLLKHPRLKLLTNHPVK